MIHLEQLQDMLQALMLSDGHEIISIPVSIEKVLHLAKIIGSVLQPGDWIFLDGDLGTGKTALTRELSSFFGAQKLSTSPTFSLIQSENVSGEHPLKKIIHLDLYRLKSNEELIYLGLENEFSSKNSIVIMEWPYQIDEKGFQHFFKVTNCNKPKRILEIAIEIDETSRTYIFRKFDLGE